MSKQKIHSTTQDFIEIADIQNDVVMFKNRSACSILEVSSVNFFLLSQDEQNARIYGYISLLNSLSFPIQIVIVSKRVDMANYLKLIDQRIGKTQNQRVIEHLTLYKDFIQELIKGEGLLDKKIYVVVAFNPLELGAVSTAKGQKADYVTKVREALASKRANLVSQIERMGLSAKVLMSNELSKIFYELFNGENIALDFNSSDVKNIIM